MKTKNNKYKLAHVIMMNKQGISKLSLAFDISGITLIIVAIVIVKLANQPLVEILAGVLATVGFGLIAGAKYV